MLAPDFSDAASEVEGFASTWEGADVADCEVQTDELEMVHQRTQHPKTREVEMQSEAVEVVGAVPLARSGFQKLRELDAFLEHIRQ